MEAAQKQEILPPEEQIHLPTTVDYDITNEAIAELADKYTDMSADTTEGYQEVTKGIAEMRGLRIKVEDARKEKGGEAREYVKLVNEEAKRITELMAPIETDLKVTKKVVDDEKEKIKAEEARIEQKRVDNHLNNISAIAQIPVNMIGKPLDDICVMLLELQERVIDESYEEFAVRAGQARQDSIKKLEVMKNEKLEAEKEAERQKILAEAREKAAKLEQEKLAEERAKLDKERQELQEREEKRLEEQRVANEKREKEVQAEREKLEKDKLEVEEMRKANEEEAKANAEKQKVEAEKTIKQNQERPALGKPMPEGRPETIAEGRKMTNIEMITVKIYDLLTEESHRPFEINTLDSEINITFEEV